MVELNLYNFSAMTRFTVLALDWNEAHILEDYYNQHGYHVELTKLN